MLGAAHDPFRVSQRPGEGVFQPAQHVHDDVQRADHLGLLRQVEREVLEVRRVLLKPATRADATR